MNEEDQIDFVFSTIGNAAQLLSMVRPGDCAKAFRSQMDRSFITDPTMALQVLAKKKDVDQKLRLLDAAAKFVEEFTAVADEVVAQAAAQEEAEQAAQKLSAKAIREALSPLDGKAESDG